jgi:hypothetical protein
VVPYFPLVPQFAAETKYIDSNVPGTSTDVTTFSTLKVQKYDDSFTTTLPSFGEGCPWPVRYARSALSGGSFDVYTKNTTSTSLNC